MNVMGAKRLCLHGRVRGPMATTDGGRLVAKALHEEGVRTVFTLCGGHIMPIYEGCLDRGIRVIDVRHEQAATMAGDAWARLTHEAGVAMVTAGPGVMNGITGIANAQRSDSPLVTIGGGADVEHYEQGALQEGPQASVITPLTKYARVVYETRRLEDYTHQAFRHALAPRTGPTFIEIPWDLLFKEGDEHESVKGLRRVAGAPRADSTALAAAIDLLAAAERPVVLVGGSVHWSRGAADVRALADVLEAPFYSNGLARGTIPPRHPAFFQLSRGKALATTDCVLNLGTPFDFRTNFAEGIPTDANVIHADVDAGALGVVRPVDVGLVGSLAAIASDLAAALKGREQTPRKAWLATLRDEEDAKRAKQARDAASAGNPIHAMRLVKAVADAVDDDTVFIGDGGNVVALAGKVVEVAESGAWMDPGPFGTLGVGLPFAIAAKAAHPRKRVLVLSGDGSFGLNGFEIDTMVRHGLPAVVVVGNDGAWTQIRAPQLALYGEERAVATKLADRTRYDLFAEAMGGHGEFVTDADGIAPAIDRAFASGKPAVVNVIIDATTNMGAGKPM